MKYYLIVFLFSLGVHAEKLVVNETSKRETYSDLIKKAQNLSLQKDRLQAAKILTRAIRKEHGSARRELLAALKELTEIFYSEKAQQLYELGESIKTSSAPTAIERFGEALKLEFNNVQILRVMARAELSIAACDRALDLSNQALDTNPFEEDIILLKAQSLACLNRSAEVNQLLDQTDYKKSSFRIYFDLVRAQTYLFEEKAQQAESFVDRVISVDSKYPESYYWLALIKAKLKKEALDAKQKYVSLCLNVSADLRRKYQFEPRLCLEKKNIEAEVERELGRQSEG